MLKYGLFLTHPGGNPFEEIISVEGYLIVPDSKIVAIWVEYKGMKEVLPIEPVEGSLSVEVLDEHLKQAIKRIKNRIEFIKKLEEENADKRVKDKPLNS